MIKMICFDMDGTLADLYGVNKWLEKLRNEDPSPYAEAAPLLDIMKLLTVLDALKKTGWEIRVISWLSKNSSESYKEKVREAKRNWIKKYNIPVDHIHLVQYGATKADSVRKCPIERAILVDDDFKVRKGWHLGETIDPTKEDIIKRLWEVYRGE